MSNLENWVTVQKQWTIKDVCKHKYLFLKRFKLIEIPKLQSYRKPHIRHLKKSSLPTTSSSGWKKVTLGPTVRKKQTNKETDTKIKTREWCITRSLTHSARKHTRVNLFWTIKLISESKFVSVCDLEGRPRPPLCRQGLNPSASRHLWTAVIDISKVVSYYQWCIYQIISVQRQQKQQERKIKPQICLLLMFLNTLWVCLKQTSSFKQTAFLTHQVGSFFKINILKHFEIRSILLIQLEISSTFTKSQLIID